VGGGGYCHVRGTRPQYIYLHFFIKFAQQPTFIQFFFFFGKNRIKNGIIEDFASLRSVSSSHCWSSPKAFRWQPFPLPPL
jgi:hypothetical protein